jgi:excisionase family DNA binding protein
VTTTEVRPACGGYDEVAKYLGIGRRSLERMVSEGKIPFWREGAIVRFRFAALDEWMAKKEAANARRLRVAR